jgi:ATP-dependent 26S proteasome regulatory subunit
MRTAITNYIRAGYPGIYLLSHEEQRVEAELKAVAAALKYRLWAWSATEGLVDTEDGAVRQANDPLEAVTAAGELPENSIVLLRDFHAFLQDANPVLVRALKDELQRAKTRGKCLLILGCRQVLPAELEREFVLLDFSLPGRPELGTVLDAICGSAGLEVPRGADRDQILDAATGMTTTEAENAYALAVIESRTVSPEVVAREKAASVKKNGLLEVVAIKAGLDDIGGLDVLKQWLVTRKDAFSQEARQYGLPSPKGLLIVGIPGTGKSLAAKATATVFGRPLLKLDMGRIFAGLVGQSEGNLRSVIQIAEAVAPCVVWLDELEKGLAGSKSSGSTDGGTSARVFGSFISWMQEKTSPVFVVATANDVTQLPAELLRRGRFDEMFFVDLPNTEERRAIWEIQISRYGRRPQDFDIRALVEMSEGYTGAEVQSAMEADLFTAFSEHREPTTQSLCGTLGQQVPLSKLMAEQITGLRKWAAGRCRMATSPGKELRGRRLAA